MATREVAVVTWRRDLVASRGWRSNTVIARASADVLRSVEKVRNVATRRSEKESRGAKGACEDDMFAIACACVGRTARR